MPFQPITTTEELPSIGHTYETYCFDMKRTVEKVQDPAGKKQFEYIELAKDVAAFANSTGGVILVGACENQTTGTLASYFPVLESVAKEICDAFSKAVRERCSPAPLIDPKPIAKDSGFVVVVNVWPFPAQAVGVRSKESDAYFFPLRVGLHTIFIKPEQLPMLMLPDVRRAEILLSAIPASERQKIIFIYRRRNQKTDHIEADMSRADLIDINRSTNSVLLKFYTKNGDCMDTSIPLDAVKTTWKTDNGWHISIDGTFPNQGHIWIAYL